MNSVAPKLIPSPTYLESSTPLRASSFSSYSSFSYASSYSSNPNVNSYSNNANAESAAYILNIRPLSSGAQYAVATSSPENAIHIVDGQSLRVVSSLRGPEPAVPTSSFTFGKKAKLGTAQPSVIAKGPQAHYGGVTCVRTTGGGGGGWGAGGEALVSCGKEGSVVVWDVRSGEVGVLMHSLNPYSKPRPLLSLALSPSSAPLIAVGSELQGDDAVISFFDPRNPEKALREHASTHSDDVTVLEFAPASYSLPASSSPDSSDIDSEANYGGMSGGGGGGGRRQYLLSGSTDGLLSVSDANEEDEDEAVLCTANWGCSIAQAGWIRSSPSPNSNAKNHQTQGGGGGEMGVWAGSDMETYSTWTADLTPVLDFDVREPGVHGERGVEWVTDYLVGCYSAESGGGLRVFVGSNEGDISTLSTRNPLRASRRSPRPWYIHNSYTHSHVGVVRALCVDERNGLILTGGEDAQLNVWRDLAGSGSLYVGEEEGESEDESDEEEDEGDGDVSMDVDGEDEGRSGKGRGRKRGVSPSDDEMDGRKRRR